MAGSRGGRETGVRGPWVARSSASRVLISSRVTGGRFLCLTGEILLLRSSGWSGHTEWMEGRMKRVEGGGL